jgi:hypothetical protein
MRSLKGLQCHQVLIKKKRADALSFVKRTFGFAKDKTKTIR